jgi:hypothetical protein
MNKYAFGLSGIFLGVILLGWLVAPTGSIKATWLVEMDNGSTVTIYLKEGSLDMFRFAWARRNRFLYKDHTGRSVFLPAALWEYHVDECVKKCQVERSGDNIIIKFPFAEVTGASYYKFAPIKPPPHGTGDRTQQP